MRCHAALLLPPFPGVSKSGFDVTPLTAEERDRVAAALPDMTK